MAYELRQTNKIAFEDANSEISDKLFSFYALLSELGGSEVLVKAQEEQSELTRVEATRFSAILASWMKVQYYGMILQLSGRTDEDWIGHIERGRTHTLWDRAKVGYPDELVNAVERGLANTVPGSRLNFIDDVRLGRDSHRESN